MARISGSGTEFELLQWANDWVSLRDPEDDDRPMILSPARLLLDDAEAQLLAEDHDRAMRAWADGKSPHSGQFWREWKLVKGKNDNYLEPVR